jgi:peptidoglycan/xylan/chitin deacetylase (PgdA/CDA1 family)
VTRVSFGEYTNALAAGRLLRVVNFHNTAAGAAPGLRRHLEQIRADFVPIGFDELDELFRTGEWHADRPPVLAVFYEGYANHAAVAAPLLDELGLTGWFFIPTVFVDVPLAAQESFAHAHSIDLVEEEHGAARLALTWPEIAQLAQRHVIAAHTGTHERIDAITTEDDLEREIFGPYRRILQVTGRPPAATAFLGGSGVGHTPLVDAALRAAGYRYVFSNSRLQRLSAARIPACAGSRAGGQRG